MEINDMQIITSGNGCMHTIVLPCLNIPESDEDADNTAIVNHIPYTVCPQLLQSLSYFYINDGL